MFAGQIAILIKVNRLMLYLIVELRYIQNELTVSHKWPNFYVMVTCPLHK